MKIEVKPGKYVVAVSGGVDSMVLLNLLAKQTSVLSPQSDNGQQKTDDSSRLLLVVAHYDHGIRTDSAEDRKLVEATANENNLLFEYEEGKLGSDASEAEARQKRYDFLERIRAKYNADAIITAHHQDDLLETAILNLLRGTGRKGLSSLASNPKVMRPLLHVSKDEIRAYAEQNHLKWREDSTNADDRYLRNYIRHQIVPQFDEAAKLMLLNILEDAQTTNQALDIELDRVLAGAINQNTLDRKLFTQLPHDVVMELLATWLRRQGIADFDSKALERVAIAAKTKPPGAMIDILHGDSILITKESLALRMCER